MPHTQLNPGLAAWLGPARDDLTDDQLDVFAEAARDIDRRYPDQDDQNLRDAALSATVQHLLGDTTPDDARRALVDARRRASEASVAAQQIAILLYAGGRSGVTEDQAAEAVGITRRTLRRALGKEA